MTVVAPALTVHGDWGGTHLRLFLMQGDTLLDRASGAGIGTLTTSPADVLRASLAPWCGTHGLRTVLLCGMAGARNGLAEAPYVDCPAELSGWSHKAVRLELQGIEITIAPGLACTRTDGAPDVMRGEETQLFGALSLLPSLAHGRHIVVLPGTHSKWALLQDGTVTGFRTYLTGELFSLLKAQSSLTRTNAAVALDPAHDEPAGFAAGLKRASTTPLLSALFETRAAQLRQGRSLGWAIGFLSGLLIGHELEGALANAADDIGIMVIGDPRLTPRYAQALHARGRTVRVLDGEDCARAGLAALQTQLSIHATEGAHP